MKTENKQFRKKIWTRHEHRCKYGILRKLMEQKCLQHTHDFVQLGYSNSIWRQHTWNVSIKLKQQEKSLSPAFPSNDVSAEDPLEWWRNLSKLTWPSSQPGLSRLGSTTALLGHELPGETLKPTSSSSREGFARALGCAWSSLCKKEEFDLCLQQAPADRYPRKTFSWKWQEGISNWEGGGKRKGKAYKEMEFFTGIGDQLQRRTFFSAHLFTTCNRKPRIRELGTALRSPLKSLVIISVTTGKTD